MENVTDQSGPRFMIADDHAIFAEAFRSYLDAHYRVVGVVANGRKLVEEALRLKPDVLIVDIGMPLLNGLEAARRIHESAPRIKFVFLTMQNDPNLAAAAMQLGPVAFLLKQSGGAEVLKAIDHVLRGESYLTPRLRSEDWVEAKARARQFSKDLTSRQRDVLQLYAEGRSIKEIAGLLELSEKTVVFHKYHIMKSYGVKSNAGLVLFALNHGLISMDPDSAGHIKTAH
jgi:DNA-binding NarL/FixJ family response regulator